MDKEDIESFIWARNEMKSGEFRSEWYSVFSSVASIITLSRDRYDWTVLGIARLIDLKLLCGKSSRQI